MSLCAWVTLYVLFVGDPWRTLTVDQVFWTRLQSLRGRWGQGRQTESITCFLQNITSHFLTFSLLEILGTFTFDRRNHSHRLNGLHHCGFFFSSLCLSVNHLFTWTFSYPAMIEITVISQPLVVWMFTCGQEPECVTLSFSIKISYAPFLHTFLDTTAPVKMCQCMHILVLHHVRSCTDKLNLTHRHERP